MPKEKKNKVTLTRALARVTIIEKQLKEFSNTPLFDTTLNSNPEMVMAANLPVDEFKNRTKSKYESVMDLFNERTKLKSAIAKANVANMVTIKTIDGQPLEMPLIAAIDYKKNAESLLVEVLKEALTQRNRCLNIVNKRDSEIFKAVEENVRNGSFNDDTDDKKNLTDSLKKAFDDIHSINLVEGVEYTKIVKDVEIIEAAINEIDISLSEFNATVLIEVN